ncbi:hypothetical protein D9M73_224350 [compost metagenome]
MVAADQQRAHFPSGDRQAARRDAHPVELVGNLRARHILGRLPAPASIAAMQDHPVVADRYRMAGIPDGDVLQGALGRRGQAADLAVGGDGEDLAARAADPDIARR